MKTRDGIKQQALDCYYDLIMSNLDPNSPLQEEDSQLNQIYGEDMIILSFSLPLSKKGNNLSVTMTLHSFNQGIEKLMRKNS